MMNCFERMSTLFMPLYTDADPPLYTTPYFTRTVSSTDEGDGTIYLEANGTGE